MANEKGVESVVRWGVILMSTSPMSASVTEGGDSGESTIGNFSDAGAAAGVLEEVIVSGGKLDGLDSDDLDETMVVAIVCAVKGVMQVDFFKMDLGRFCNKLTLAIGFDCTERVGAFVL